MSAAHESQRLARVYELANAFARRIERDDLIPFALERCREVLSASGVSILLLDREKKEFYFPFVAEGDAEAARQLAATRIPADHGVAGAVLQSGRSELIRDVSADSRFYSAVDRKTGTATGSLLASPLFAGEQRLGVIEAVRRAGAAPFNEDELALFELLAGSIAVALENAGRFAEMRESADRLRIEVGALRRELARNDRFAEIIAVSPAMTNLFRRVEAAAASDRSVLIQGETGTGKELVARAIHRISARGSGPLVAINCAAVPEGLLESELFGHRRGAFSGAMEDQIGLFRAAADRVLFLDEIGEMPMQMQAKLLRALQEGEVKPVGDVRSYKVDVRVISATNRDLETDVAQGRFRRDLFYRLNAFTIKIPPLRERREDIQLMAARFLEAAARARGKAPPGFTPEALAMLCGAPWPGNVRQLQNEIEQAFGMAGDSTPLAPEHFSSELTGAVEPSTEGDSSSGQRISTTAEAPSATGTDTRSNAKSLIDARARFEASFIASVLAEHKGNVSHAAVALGVSRVTLQKKMKEYALR